jgi:hypothetical protein
VSRVYLKAELSLCFASPIRVAVEKKEKRRRVLAGGVAVAYKLSGFLESDEIKQTIWVIILTLNNATSVQ